MEVELEVKRDDEEKYKITSENFAERLQKKDFDRLDNDLIDGVILMGSTSSLWRNEVIPELTTEEILTMNPQIVNGSWEDNKDKYAEAESRMMAEAGTLSVYIDNVEGVEDGSLGSLVEIANALYSARMRRQRVVVSFAEDYDKSLREAGAKVEYQLVMKLLDDIAEKNRDLLTLKKSASVQEHAHSIKEATLRQRVETREAVTDDELRGFNEKKKAKTLGKEDNERKVVIGGSSRGFNDKYQERLLTQQASIAELLTKRDQAGQNLTDVVLLNEGKYGKMWTKIDEEGDDGEKQRLIKKAVEEEWGEKIDADVLVWILDKGSVSKGASAELAFYMLNAFNTGQQLCILIEDFDEESYAETTDDEKAIANAKRVRTIASKQAEQARRFRDEKLAETGYELFSITTDPEEFGQRLAVIKDKEGYKKREEFLERYREFNKDFRQRVVDGRVTKENFVVELQQAIADHSASGAEKWEDLFFGLLDHLDESWAGSTEMGNVLADAGYLEHEQIKLMMDIGVPLHDAAKFFGEPGSEYMEDHEIFIGHIFETYLPQLKDENGEQAYTEEQAGMLAAVFRNHENIYKEEGRREYSQSEDEVERMQAAFFAIDVLGSAVSVNDRGELAFDEDDGRYADLLLRHINGNKALRPEWAVSTTGDIVAYFKTLEQDHGIKLEDGFLDKFFKVTEGVLNISEFDPNADKNTQRKQQEYVEKLENEEYRSRVEKVKEELKLEKRATLHSVWKNEGILEEIEDYKEEGDKKKLEKFKRYIKKLTELKRRVFQDNHNTIKPASAEFSRNSLVSSVEKREVYGITMTEIINDEDFGPAAAARINRAFESSEDYTE